MRRDYQDLARPVLPRLPGPAGAKDEQHEFLDWVIQILDGRDLQIASDGLL
jgi:hypothetical protein